MFLSYHQNSILCKFLESKPVGMLRKLSLQIYGLHWTLINTVGAFPVIRGYFGNILLDGIVAYLTVVILTLTFGICVPVRKSLLQEKRIKNGYAE